MKITNLLRTKHKKSYQLTLFFFGSFFILFFFNNVLVFPNEAFYMGLPLFWLWFHLIYQPDIIRKWFRWTNIFRSAGSFILILGYFWYLSHSMGWRIIFKEVLLAAYFLLAVGVVVHWLRCVIQLVASAAEKIVNNKRWQKLAYKVIFVILWSLTILPYIMATFTIHRPKIGDQTDPRKGYDLPFEQVKLRTQDDVNLSAWYVPRNGSKKSVVIGHGLGANKSNFLPLVKLWHDLGYNSIIFDFRGHGESEGHTLTFGMREKYDILAAVDFLYHQPELDTQEIVGYGVSFGAAALIHAAAEDQRIRVIVIDSSFADVETMARKVVDALYLVPPFFKSSLANIGLVVVNLEAGFDIREASPKRIISRLEGRPVLMIHGTRDKLIPFSEAQILYSLLKEPKEHFWIDTPGHYATLVDPWYGQRIKDFLSQQGGQISLRP